MYLFDEPGEVTSLVMKFIPVRQNKMEPFIIEAWAKTKTVIL